MKLPLKKVEQIIDHRLRRCGLRDTATLCHVSRQTVTRWGLEVGDGCRRLLSRHLRNLDVRQIQVDELSTFIHTKQKHLTAKSSPDHGAIFVYAALDTFSRAVVTTKVGPRNFATTLEVMAKLRARVMGRASIVSDGYKPYTKSIQLAFGSNVDFAQLEKHYISARLPNGKVVADVFVDSTRTAVLGAPDLASASTSYIERLFGTLRERSSKLIRKSRCHAKSKRHLVADIYLFNGDYNFCRTHTTLKKTPFEALGLTDHAWSLKELIAAALAEPEPEPLQLPAWAKAPESRSPESCGSRTRDRIFSVIVPRSSVDAWKGSAETASQSLTEWIERHLDAAKPLNELPVLVGGEAVDLKRLSPPERRRLERVLHPRNRQLHLKFASEKVASWRARARSEGATFGGWVRAQLDGVVADNHAPRVGAEPYVSASPAIPAMPVNKDKSGPEHAFQPAQDQHQIVESVVRKPRVRRLPIGDATVPKLLTRRTKYEDALRELARLLRRGPITAKRVVAEMGCSKVALYLRLRELEARGHVFQTRMLREGLAGPLSKAYALVGDAVTAKATDVEDSGSALPEADPR